MRVKFQTIAVICALSLSACGRSIDDAQNIPLQGHWKSTTTLGSVEFNGRTLKAEEVPPVLIQMVAKKSPSVENECSEPKVNNSRQILALMSSPLADRCIVTSEESDASTRNVVATCDGSKFDKGLDSVSFRNHATIAADSVIIRANVNVTAKEPSGQSVRMRMSLKQELVRIGNCPA